MKLVIDCFKLVKGNGKSIGIYNLTKNLVHNLAKENMTQQKVALNNKDACLEDGIDVPGKKTRRKKDQIIVLGTKYNQEDFDIPGVKFVKVKYNPLNKVVCILWELYLVTIALEKIGADRVLYPRGFAPLKQFFGKTEQYVIIHDMIPFYYDKNYPGVLNPLENFYIMWRLKASAKTCHKVLTDSQASKDEIVRIANINPWVVEVVYPGQNKIEFAKIREFTEGPAYISAIASGLPHKNADGVIACYKKYCESLCNKVKITAVNDVESVASAEEENVILDYSNALDLKIIGISDVDKYHLPKEIAEKITCYKYLEKDEDMHKIIRGSAFFLFLSKIEGFGFPPLEAMQLGVPVVSSNASSLPEVTADAAILVNPNNIDEVVNAMKQMSEKSVQDEYRNKGYLNTGRFLWKNRIGKYQEVLLKK